MPSPSSLILYIVKALVKNPDAVTVFISPPSLEILGQRLRGRQSEDEEKCLRRLAQAEEEMKRRDEYRYVVINGDLTEAEEELNRIYRVETDEI